LIELCEAAGQNDISLQAIKLKGGTIHSNKTRNFFRAKARSKLGEMQKQSIGAKM
jgi:hypothetical protein